jgi:hypothetical protein
LLHERRVGGLVARSWRGGHISHGEILEGEAIFLLFDFDEVRDVRDDLEMTGILK